MRILMWISIGFAVACGLCVYILPVEALLTAAAIVFVCGIFLFIAGYKWKKLRIGFVVLTGIAFGLCWFNAYYQRYISPAIYMDNCVYQTELRVLESSTVTSYGSSVDAYYKHKDIPYQVRVYFSDKTDLMPGDVVKGEFRFRFSGTKNRNLAANYLGKGIFLLAYPSDGFVCFADEKLDWWIYPSVLSNGIKDILMKCFPEDVFPFVKALLLGDTGELDYYVDSDLKISGIRHVVAVSGLHVSILYSVLRMLTAKKRWLTALAGIPILAVFAAMAGFTPSVTRACIMIGLVILAEVFQREYDSATALAFSCLIMLFANPMTIGAVSFQLSVGCVSGILLFYEPIRDRMMKHIRAKKKRLINWVVSSVSVTLSAMVMTVPLSAYYFGTVSVVSILTNLLTLWAVTTVFVGIILICVLSFISVPIAAWLGSLLAYLIRYILMVAHILSRVPLAAVYTASIYIVVWLVSCYILLVVFRIGKNVNANALVFCIVLVLILALTLSWCEPLLDECRVTVLDVGQGQSILLQSEGKSLLVDCGGSSSESAADAVIHQLRSQGIWNLDAILLTHSDYDHSGGLPYLFDRVKTDVILLPATCGQYILPETEAQIVWVDKETCLEYGNTCVRVFPPEFVGKENENSLCILFTTENCDILVTGDRSASGERTLLEKYTLPDVDLLIAGHHGSSKSTSDELLNAVRPETVIISVGANNRYGHASQAFVERLEAFGCEVYRTDYHGTIIYRR